MPPICQIEAGRAIGRNVERGKFRWDDELGLLRLRILRSEKEKSTFWFQCEGEYYSAGTHATEATTEDRV